MKIISNHIKDIFYGANDGIISTFVIITGAIGASLSSNVILILGFASLIADGFSMGASNYLGTRSEQEMSGHVDTKSLYTHSVLTFTSFVIAGSLPLLPFIFGNGGFAIAAVATGVTLFVIGAFLGHFVLHKKWFVWGIEMLIIGGAAASIAFLIGRFIGQFIGA